MPHDDELAEGANNLLVGCAHLMANETLLIIAENPNLGWYDAEAPQAIARAAKSLGAHPTMLAVGAPDAEPDPALQAAIEAHDCTIYFTRIGDQVRFSDIAQGHRSVMCYTRTTRELVSVFGRAPYGAFKALKEAVNDILLSADLIEIACPLGSEYSGRISKQLRSQPSDVSVLRFPLGIHLPIDASEFSGRIALAHYLTPTGSRAYEPASIELSHTVFAEVKSGRIDGFSGNEDDVDLVREHYAMVASRFGIDPDVVHSWHAGIHPGCAYEAAAADNPDRWSNTVFSNPRVLHFHTCGNYAPGEISWAVLDPTIAVDGRELWQKGRFVPEAFGQTADCLAQWPQLKLLFENPRREIGLPV